ncbi:MAG: thiamine pyrophosphate-dependent dehydrogenase E1 component subunit alpha [Candidatus Solibacter usitatus]|nr:thiamine pyrophosphate-dependent dehydrogenase E1 component subunit alpha [Candidatus Solibacter usitatus]
MAAAKLEVVRTRQEPESELHAELARKFLYYMGLMREVEDRIERKLYRQGKIVGGVYVGRGQEAIPVGSGLAARPDDVLFPSHRDLALYLIRGLTPGQIFAQYMGRMDGLTAGREGNMHMGDLKKGLVSIISAMAASIPVAAGAAMALKYQGKDNIAWVYFGDGASSRGDWHEGINFATVQKLPLVLLCNNNQYAYSTPLSKQMACANVADRAPGYNMPAEIVDGNDVFAVHEAAQRAAAHARAGLGPYLIECKTFRMTGHSAHDPADYVPKRMFEEWAGMCPIARLEQRMEENGWAAREEIDETRAKIRREADAAIEWAEQSPYPDPSTLLDRVYES